tara:strand:- start:8330 stop:8524 length:195 start_codon:yes stop_codon:yes gene_type:complete
MKINFSFSSQYGTFSDALYLPDDHGLSDEQIEAMKQQRFDNWIAVITAPPVEETPAEEAPTEEV